MSSLQAAVHAEAHNEGQSHGDLLPELCEQARLGTRALRLETHPRNSVPHLRDGFRSQAHPGRTDTHLFYVLCPQARLARGQDGSHAFTGRRKVPGQPRIYLSKATGSSSCLQTWVGTGTRLGHGREAGETTLARRGSAPQGRQPGEQFPGEPGSMVRQPSLRPESVRCSRSSHATTRDSGPKRERPRRRLRCSVSHLLDVTTASLSSSESVSAKGKGGRGDAHV